MNSLVRHPSGDALSETEADSIEPFVFVKLEENQPIDIEATEQSVTIEERQDSIHGNDLMVSDV